MSELYNDAQIDKYQTTEEYQKIVVTRQQKNLYLCNIWLIVFHLYSVDEATEKHKSILNNLLLGTK